MPAPFNPLSSIVDGARRLLPHATVLLLLALSLTPLPFLSQILGTAATGLLHVTPPLALIGICYWSVQRPDRFGIIAAFAVGLLQDLLTGAVPGVTAFLYALIQRLGFRQHHTLRSLSLLPLWSLYGAVQVTVTLLQWALWSWLAKNVSSSMLPLGPFLVQAMLGVMLLPVVSWCLARVQTAGTKTAARGTTGRAA